MFEDTRPATLDATADENPWAPFRVTQPQECLTLLRQLRDGAVLVNLNGPEGSALGTTLWSVDATQRCLSFSVGAELPALHRLVEADEAVAVAYMDSVKLQFDLHHLMLVRGKEACALQAALPANLYRFQRRGAFRVRTAQRQAATAHFRHPAMPDMALALRVLDLSIGGCALWLPREVPTLQAGTHIGELVVELDAQTRFSSGLVLQHVTSLGRNDAGVRLGCEWQKLGGQGERLLQRWIDTAQKRQRLLAPE